MEKYTSKDTIFNAIIAHEEKIKKLYALYGSMKEQDYDWENETLEQKIYVEWFADKVQSGLFNPVYKKKE